MENDLLRIADAARLCGLTPARIGQAIKMGQLETYPGLPVKVLRRSDVERFRDMPRRSNAGRPRDPNSRRSRAAARKRGQEVTE